MVKSHWGFMLAALFGSATAVHAANGDLLVQFDAAVTAGIPQCSSGVGTGIAFDGESLILSCYASNVLQKVDAVDHTSNGTLTIAGVSSLGAMAYDAGRDRIWACSGFSTVVLIDPNTQALDPSHTPFSVSGCFDGLAYDGEDDSIWASGDVHTTVGHYTPAGALIGTHSTSGLFSPGNSGIAVGGEKLYLSNNGGSQVYEVDKGFTSATLFATFERRLEDSECDGRTFSDQGVGAVWVQDAYDRILTAWEIERGLCEFGGGIANDAAAEGYVARIRIDGLPLDTAKVGRAAAQIGETDDQAIVDEEAPGVLSVEAGSTSASATETESGDDATVTESVGTAKVTGLSIAGGSVTADVVFARAEATFDGATETGETSSEGSGFVNLSVGGTPIADAVPANTTIPIPGVGTVFLREEVVEAGENNVAIRVNMIRFASDDGASDVVVASASATAGEDIPSFDDPGAVAPEVPLPPLPDGSPTLPAGGGFSEGFEGGQGEWTTDGSNLWEFGPPTYGPGAAAEGDNVAATILGGSYPNGANAGLRSPPIDLTGFDPGSPLAPGSRALLTFQSWLRTEPWYDCGVVSVSTDGGATFTTVEPLEGYPYGSSYCGGLYPSGSFSGSEPAWTPYSVDLTPFAGSEVVVEFRFGSDGSVTYPGWYVDDLVLSYDDGEEAAD